MKLPKTGWPARAVPELINLVDAVVQDRRVVRFKIGRTNDPPTRHRNYALEYRPAPRDLHPIYQTGSAEHALQVEHELITWFHAHPKSLNVNAHSGGGLSPEYVQYVYVALWVAE